ncbi:hypothetical protein R1flu_001407 [Riccia fluitans]|uniref:Uncharacterized protein n=1 Tax=Riccia fluitans TaxID=41844 RepID=A0ABD1Y661_9MARC
MASQHCISCAILSSSGAAGTPLKRLGSVDGCQFIHSKRPNLIARNFEHHGVFRFNWKSRNMATSSGRIPGVSVPCYAKREWSEKSEPRMMNSNLLTCRERFVVSANASRRNFLFQLGDDEVYEEGPIELPPRELEIDPLAFPEANPLQIAASFLLTGSIAFLLIRSLRRRAQRAKEMQFRSTGVATSKSIKEDARKAAVAKLTQAPEVPVAPPSPAQTFFGAVVAGIIALLLYQVTTTVEGSFIGKPVSMNYSIRNLTITVRTIINGLLYLATFVFAANSIEVGRRRQELIRICSVHYVYYSTGIRNAVPRNQRCFQPYSYGIFLSIAVVDWHATAPPD